MIIRGVASPAVSGCNFVPKGYLWDIWEFEILFWFLYFLFLFRDPTIRQAQGGARLAASEATSRKVKNGFPVKDLLKMSMNPRKISNDFY